MQHPTNTTEEAQKAMQANWENQTNLLSPLKCEVSAAQALLLMFPEFCREIIAIVPTQVHHLRIRETSMSKARLKPSLSSARRRRSFRPKALTVPSSPAPAVAPSAAWPKDWRKRGKPRCQSTNTDQPHALSRAGDYKPREKLKRMSLHSGILATRLAKTREYKSKNVTKSPVAPYD